MYTDGVLLKAPCWERNWDLLHFSHLCSYGCGIPAEQGMGKQRSSFSTQNFSLPVQQQGVLHSLIYLISHCAMLQQEHYPSSPSHVCKRWRMQAEGKKKGSPSGSATGWFLLSLAHLLEAQHSFYSKRCILYTCNWMCTKRFCRLTTSEKTCCMASGYKAASCSNDGCGCMAPWAVFWPTSTSREEEKFCRRRVLRSCTMLTRQGASY